MLFRRALDGVGCNQKWDKECHSGPLEESQRRNGHEERGGEETRELKIVKKVSLPQYLLSSLSLLLQ
jgi:hypothetical protein